MFHYSLLKFESEIVTSTQYKVNCALLFYSKYYVVVRQIAAIDTVFLHRKQQPFEIARRF